MHDRFEGHFYLVLSQGIEGARFLWVCEKFYVFCLSENPDVFGVMVDAYKSDFPNLMDAEIEEAYGIDDITTHRISEAVVTDPETCLPLGSDVDRSILDDIESVFDVLALPDGRRAIRAGFYAPRRGQVAPRITHEVYSVVNKEGV